MTKNGKMITQNDQNEKDDQDHKNSISEPSYEQEGLSLWAKKSKLEQTLTAGIMGTPQLGIDEKRRYLGEFRERIIKYLTIEQVEEDGTYPEILEAIVDPRAKKLIVSDKANLEAAREYIQLALRNNLKFTTVSSPNYKGEIGLLVVSGEAVDENRIDVPTEEEKLLEKGIPSTLIAVRGEKICQECYKLLEEKAPEELSKYRLMTLFDSILGKKCPSKHHHNNK